MSELFGPVWELVVCFVVGVAILAFVLGHFTANRSPVVPQIGSAISYIPPCPSITPGKRAGPCVAKP